jgi:hypothetical protein
MNKINYMYSTLDINILNPYILLQFSKINDIAQNFSNSDAEADVWVKWVLDLEDSLIQQHLIQSDFMSFVCRI